MLETVAKLKLLYEIGEYVIREKPNYKKLLTYLEFLKDGYENKLVNQVDKLHTDLFERKTKRRGVKTK